MIEPAPLGDIAIYVHWPFCLAKCPYCDFNSHVRENIDQGSWAAAYERELDYYAGVTNGRQVTSVFFGGGTPSLMTPEIVSRVLARIAGHWRLAPECEITLEANPTSVEVGRFSAYRRAGVNRVSVGVQALEDTALQALGREHSVAEACRAVDAARTHFPRFSVDLIYARPGQTLAGWRRELGAAIALGAGHLSLYQLTVEPGTPFFQRQLRGDLVLPDEDLSFAFYQITQELTEAAGFRGYEISNHARAGEISRHNMTYWRYADYIGVGPGAHSRGRFSEYQSDALEARRQYRSPERWLGAVAAEGHGTAEIVALNTLEIGREMLLMGLRLDTGVTRDRFMARTGRQLEDALEPGVLDRFVAEGYVEISPDSLRITRQGRLLLNRLLAELVA